VRQGGKNVDMSDQDQIMNRPRAGDDDLHPSKSHALQSIDFTMEVFEKTAQFCPGNPLGLVRPL
jgi:hypothetical protein